MLQKIPKGVKPKGRTRDLQQDTYPEQSHEARLNQYSAVLGECNQKAFLILPSISTEPGPNSDLSNCL